MVGVLYQRTIVLAMLLFAGIALLWSQAEKILLAIGQDPDISRGAARYLNLLLPALLASVFFEASKRYLMVQVSLPETICQSPGHTGVEGRTMANCRSHIFGYPGDDPCPPTPKLWGSLPQEYPQTLKRMQKFEEGLAGYWPPP
jgi:hypothetical protein